MASSEVGLDVGFGELVGCRHWGWRYSGGQAGVLRLEEQVMEVTEGFYICLCSLAL